jgi:pSer/pThr/pTyr-binding forkhead associated (FHA) protein/S1-C subfamily serine protease
MPLLVLRDTRTDAPREFTGEEVRLGRDPALECAIEGEGRRVVSALHAKLVHRDGSWWLEDLASRNGTYLDDRRLEPGRAERIAVGAVISLGKEGVRLRVEVVREARVSETVVEDPRNLLPASAVRPTEMVRPHERPRAIVLALRDVATAERFEARGMRVRVGRGTECDVRPVPPFATGVSRVHAELVLEDDGAISIRDAGSTNGTFVNGELLAGPLVVALGDRIQLGPSGPELVVERLEGGTPAPASPAAAGGTLAARRSFGGQGRTAFFAAKFDETMRGTSRRVRVGGGALLVVLLVAVGGLLWHGERRVRATAQLLTSEREAAMARERAVADSMRRAAEAEYARLEAELGAARAGAAPASVLDSLRTALADAGARAADLEVQLERTRTEMERQIAAGDSLRREAQGDLQRLQSELARATASQVPAALVDSLRAAVAAAEDRATALASQVRAVRGGNLAAVAQANQGAVGLVTVYFGDEMFDGSGFAVTTTGYFVTNRHNVVNDGAPADSIFVTMADQQFMVRADLVAAGTPGGPDLAVLKVRHYAGPSVQSVDWAGEAARQGEPAALIGFPAGLATALDQTQTVRTSMSAGIFSKVTAAEIQFDGFTVSGSSGSPVFNAAGDVVAVHRAGLRETAGLGFAVPVGQLAEILPADVRAELGIERQ